MNLRLEACQDVCVAMVAMGLLELLCILHSHVTNKCLSTLARGTPVLMVMHWIIILFFLILLLLLLVLVFLMLFLVFLVLLVLFVLLVFLLLIWFLALLGC